jgi:hypothetical protein
MKAKEKVVVQKCTFTIRDFCDAHNISIPFLYDLFKKGEGPCTIRLGNRRLISVEEAARWRAERTAASSTETHK